MTIFIFFTLAEIASQRQLANFRWQESSLFACDVDEWGGEARGSGLGG